MSNEQRERSAEPTKRDTKLRIIRTADNLFCRKGVSATTMGEVIMASGVNPAQFCYCFRNKRSLVQAVLETYVHSVVLGGGDLYSDLKSWKDVEQCLLRLICFQKRSGMARGCPLGSVGSEVGEGDELIRRDVSLLLEAKASRLANFFAGEKEKGRLSKKAKPVDMADFFVAAVQGGMLIGKINRDYRSVQRIFRDTLLHLRSYVTKPQGHNSLHHDPPRKQTERRTEAFREGL